MAFAEDITLHDTVMLQGNNLRQGDEATHLCLLKLLS